MVSFQNNAFNHNVLDSQERDPPNSADTPFEKGVCIAWQAEMRKDRMEENAQVLSVPFGESNGRSPLVV